MTAVSSSAAVRAALTADDPAVACSAARSESRALLEAICAALPTGADRSSWADLTLDVAVRDLLRDMARLVVTARRSSTATASVCMLCTIAPVAHSS